MGKGLCHLCEHSRVLYLKIEGLNGLPILVIGELAKKCPLLLQVFIKPLKREQDGGKILHLDKCPGPPGRNALPSCSHTGPFPHQQIGSSLGRTVGALSPGPSFFQCSLR